LDRGQEEANQYADDGDDHEKLNESKALLTLWHLKQPFLEPRDVF